MQPIEIFHTECLIAERLRAEHFSELRRMHRDPRVMATLAPAGLHNTHVGGDDEVELAYALMAEFWGRGLATEMAEEIIRMAFEKFHMTDVVCFTLTTNRASQRVMEKAGFEYERDVVHAGLPHVLYHITAS